MFLIYPMQSDMPAVPTTSDGCYNWVLGGGTTGKKPHPNPLTPGPCFFQPLPSLLCSCSWQNSWPVTMMKTFTSSTPLTATGLSMLRDIRVTEITPQVRLSCVGFCDPSLLAWRSTVSHLICESGNCLGP